ncbi:hypothetical protein LTS18_014639, partial [Coniosporium uncinatum]
MLRVAARARPLARIPTSSMAARPAFIAAPTAVVSCRVMSATANKRAAAADPHDPHHEESFEDFTARYKNEFDNVQDVFELQ